MRRDLPETPAPAGEFGGYLTRETPMGVWRRHVYASGAVYAEFRSHYEVFGLPLVHYASGICPETGVRTTAAGIVAIGRKAVGLVAVGRMSAGLVAVGQVCAGLFSLGQAALGLVAVGQFGMGVLFGLGQLATGRTVIGQLALGGTVLAQLGLGGHVWSPEHADPVAQEHFRGLLKSVLEFFGA